MIKDFILNNSMLIYVITAILLLALIGFVFHNKKNEIRLKNSKVREVKSEHSEIKIEKEFENKSINDVVNEMKETK